MRIWHRVAALAAGFSLLCCVAGAADLSVPGLGTIPLGGKLELTDCGGSALEKALVSRRQAAGLRQTSLMLARDIASVPPGMKLYSEKGASPIDRLHLYQLIRQDPRGTYTASLMVVDGSGEEFFPRERDREFWRNAFHKDSTRPTSLFGRPKISMEEYQSLFDEVLHSAHGPEMKVKVVSFAPWHAFRNGDGSYRWEQSTKIIVTNDKGLSYPVWMDSMLLKNKGRYYLLCLEGSHVSSSHISEPWVTSVYQIRRETVGDKK